MKSGIRSIILIIGLLTACANPIEIDTVSITGRKIMLNNEPYFIKGICYHPVPKGSDQRDFSRLEEDLKLMVEAGINTVRVYEPIDDENVLDKFYNAGVKLIIGIGYNQGGNYDIKSGSFINYVKKYKTHKAILFWELGNEYNYHPEWFDGTVKNWYAYLNEAANDIKNLDLNHPVATAHGELPDALALKLCPTVDIWGMNVYRWDNPSKIYKEWAALSDKPMYLSEAGGDSYMTIAKNGYQEGGNEKAQADANAKILAIVFNNKEIGAGITLFSFTDGWWKSGNLDQQDIGGWAPNSTGVPYDGSPNEEYWGIVDIERNKKKTYEIVKEWYKKANPR